jgi:hypothetical protein
MNSCIAPPQKARDPEGDAYIVGYYAVVAGVEVDGLPENCVDAKFVELTLALE